ncbi:class I SAM-dependent methyltransferase [Aquirufa ecclesiirivi]|uniref:class I SAM-dependent methyltransferase n=1 Tax=Aquirufa ecclesiirivi TaxID=2715124 RepID=UPI0022A83BF9|nr:class I SAM-dependent methyltransferase [Aquirufa ecclesiirivi]
MKLSEHELGFLQVDPLPSLEELNDYYEKSYYQETTSSTYQSTYSESELQYINNKIAQRAAVVLEKIKYSGKLLDVGCGEGFVLAFFKKLGWSVEGIDFSDFGILNFNPTLINQFEKGDIYNILNRKLTSQDKYDVLWLGNVLEHVLDPVDLLEKLKLLLAKNGILVITVPNDASKYQELLFTEGYVEKNWWIIAPDHISYFNYQTLQNTCNFTGFKVEQVLGDFPIDLFLLHKGSNYVSNKSLGKEAHNARVRMENFISENKIEDINQFYSSLAKVGLGRDLTIFLSVAK